MIREREILGIYLDESRPDVFCLKKRLGRWSPGQVIQTFEDLNRSLADQIKGILKGIRPSRRRTICLGIPRKALFLRELSFPQLEPEEAANAVRMGIGLHSHLKPDEIYHDQWAFRRSKKTVVLLVYIPRNFLDPVLRAIRETGHAKSLGPISPASLGLDILLRAGEGAPLPCTCLCRQGDSWIVSLHGVHAWEGSHPVSVPEGGDISEALKGLSKYLPFPFSRYVMAPVYIVGDLAGTTPEVPLRDPCDDLKGLSGISKQTTWGLCAASLGLSSFPSISLQEGPRHQPFRLRIRPYQLVAGALAVAIILATGTQGMRLRERLHSVQKMKNEIAKLERRLSPMLATQKQLDQVNGQLKDLRDFRSERPSALVVLKALADYTPPETWIRTLNLRGDRVRIRAQGSSAVETMGRWRNSPLFSEVKLVSPVTKDSQQREHFSVEIDLITKKGVGHGS